ncbi:hypothetical protein Mtc_0196 [Methanocella conradii HZ254]|uniref:Uncharacterized protein n=1 Tax=Methanocella conradii (strain DSM 24694 / JCM 17849 / CGMCC 1.5162 / HZ254) TaxID=1041930 RepID=H8I8B4_METCZ|nr:glycosyltransferase family 39 protein [Methanocella conradii]AFC98967.1 hypothetical protein Mtc_0196 [Methanocella conradii HZ254]MDI6898164.1 glycosyltransferase family 39 protein [Methanocella conradii]
MGAAGGVVSFIRKHMALCLFLTLFIVFNLNMRANASVDTIPASLLPFSILQGHGLYLDEFMEYFTSIWSPPIGFLYERGGHYLSVYPIVIPLVLTPLYVLPCLALKLLDVPFDLYDPTFRLVVMGMEKLGASLIAALSGVFIYLALRRLTKEKTAILSALIFALATNVWAINSQALWQHGMSGLLLSILIFQAVEGGQKSRGWAICMGAVSALFFFNRPSDSFLLIPIIYYIETLKDRQVLFYYCLALAITALPFLAYNLYYFGSPIGGFNRMSSMLSLGGMPMGVLGLLVSPSRGILIFTPIILLAVPGYLKIRTIADWRLRRLLYLSGLAILAEVLLYGSFSDWHGGGCFGPRYLTCILPYAAVMISLFLDGLSGMKKAEWLAIAIITLLVAYSVFIQFLGAFSYPNGGYRWDQEHVLYGDEKYWNWRDNQIGYCLRSGIWSPLNVVGYVKDHILD